MLDMEASGKWAEKMLARIKSSPEDKDFPALLKAIDAMDGQLAEPRYPAILRWHISFRQRQIDAQRAAGKRARLRIDQDLIALGLRPAGWKSEDSP